MRPDCPVGHHPPEHPCDWPDCRCFATRAADLKPMLVLVCDACRTGVGVDPYDIMCDTQGCVFCRPEGTALKPARTREEMVEAHAEALYDVCHGGALMESYRVKSEAVLIRAGVIEPSEQVDNADTTD